MRVSELLAMAVLLVGAGAPAAESGRSPLIVLDLEAKGVTPLQAEAATQGVVRGLRELDVFQVLSSADVRQLLALERTRQLLGDESSGGGSLLQTLGARYAVAGTVTKVGAGLQVEIRLLDTRNNTVQAQKTFGPVQRMEQLATGLPPMAQELVSGLLKEQQGSLLVRCQEEAAEVVVDDVLSGSTPLEAPLKLSRGSHRVQVRKDGFIAQSRTVKIAPEQLTVEEFTLLPSADYAEAYKTRYDRLRVGAYIATAAAVVGIGGAIVLDRAFTEPLYQREFLPRQYVANGVTFSKLPPALQQDPAFKATYTQCGSDYQTCYGELKGYQGQLIGLQAATIGLGVVGVVATGTAAYLWLTGKDPNRYAGLVASFSVGPEPGFAIAGRF